MHRKLHEMEQILNAVAKKRQEMAYELSKPAKLEMEVFRCEREIRNLKYALEDVATSLIKNWRASHDIG